MKKLLKLVGLMLLPAVAMAQSLVMVPQTSPVGGLVFQSTSDKNINALELDRKGFVRIRNEFGVRDDFNGRSLDLTKWYATAGTNASVSVVVSDTGMVSMTLPASTTLSTSGAQLTSERNFKPSKGPVSFETRVLMDSSSTIALFAGLINSTSLITPVGISATAGGLTGVSATTSTFSSSNLVGFVFDSSASWPVNISTSQPFWRIAGNKDSVSTSVPSTGVTPTALANGAWQTLRMNVDTLGNASFYIDGRLVGNLANAVSATETLTPYVGGISRGAGHFVNVDYLQTEQNLSATPRRK